jgi:predicted nucleic acid-binding protein
LTTVDTSVLVAGYATWHEHHDAARRALRDAGVLVAHTALETLSVLTRLPPPHRVAPEVVWPYLEQFQVPWISASGARHVAIVRRLASASITGGAVYDAYVGVLALDAAAQMVTFDRRAAVTYERLGVHFRLL